MEAKTHIAVIGAGAFGGWTALYLLRRGARVTLLDAWGPGNSRASSGGETRVIRGTYGPNQPYTKMAARATQLWKENEKRWSHEAHAPDRRAVDGDRGRRSFRTRVLARCCEMPGSHYQELSVQEMAARWPQINLEAVHWGIYEPDGGFLAARSSLPGSAGWISCGRRRVPAGGCRTCVISTVASGTSLTLSDGSNLTADQYVFACGPWLGKLFRETVGSHIRATKQDVFFFGAPAGDTRFTADPLPVWADHRDRFIYGIPGNQGRGFKVADDTRGPEFDPTSGERTVSPEGLKVIRDYIGFRFPALERCAAA